MPIPKLMEPVQPDNPSVKPIVGSMGLHGMWAQIGNATAMVVIVVAFLYGLRQQFEAAAEDRQIFRQEMSLVHAEREAERQANLKVADAVRDMTLEIRAIKRSPP
jgi:hypothetical protein